MMSNSNGNIGAYGEYDFVESIANAKLSIKLQESKLFKTHFAEGDKLPNLDGNIEFLSKKVRNGKNGEVIVYEPEGSIYVQIKTLSHDYNNNNVSKFKEFKYKYSMDTKVINLVNVGARLEPVIIFLIDEKNNKFFWIHVSDEYALGLEVEEQGNKVIYFSDENELISATDFYIKVSFIYRTRLKQVRDAESNRLMLLNMTADTRVKAQKLLNYLDETLINEFPFLTEYYYPDIWKFGVYLSYNETTKQTALAIYEIKYGSVDTVCLKNFRSVNEVESSFVISGTDKENDFIEFGKLFVQSLLHEYFKSNIINPKYLPNIVLHELAFSLLDTIANKCRLFEKEGFANVYYKDSVNCTELINHLKTLKKFTQLKIDKLNKYIESSTTVMFDPLRNLANGDCEIYKSLFDEMDNEEEFFYQSNYEVQLYSDTIPYKLYQNVIRELQIRSENVINRVWNHQNIIGSFKELNELKVRGHSRIESGYLLKDIYFNTEKYLLKFPQIYNETMSKLIQSSYVSKYSIQEKSFYFMNEEDPNLELRWITFENKEYTNVVNELPSQNITLEEVLSADLQIIRESVNALSCSSGFIPLRVRSSKFRALFYNELVEKLYSIISERNYLNIRSLSPLRLQL